MVGGMTLGRQPPGLDREREDHRRAVDDRVRLRERVEQHPEVVAAEVADRAHQLLVIELVDQLLQRAAVGACLGEALAELVGRRAQHPLVLLVGHLVDPPAQLRATVALEQLTQLAAVLDRDHVPARRLEHRRQAARGDVGHNPVERLAVEVDDPQHLAQARDDRIDDRLPARALIELGVADQRHLPPSARDIEVTGDVAMRERAPDRGGRPDPNRSGREVSRDRILEPARVALQPAELPQRRQVALVERPEQVLDRMQHRRRMRLDRHAVGVTQVVEVERGHDRNHRRRRRLVAADLYPGRGPPHAVGVVDDRGREPQDARLHRL